jgi:copper chaperone CopZ
MVMDKLTQLRIEGMSCPRCVEHVKKALEAVPGVISASVTLDHGATVRHTGVSTDHLRKAVATAGSYRAEALECGERLDDRAIQ